MNRSHLWLTSLLAGSALAGQIQVGRPPPRQPEKPVVGADQRDPQELLGDCPEQLMRAVRAIDVALVELADCRAASPDNNCPRLELPLAKAEATYEAVDRSCTALEQPIYRVSRPKADAAIAEDRAASDAARALKADPDRAGAAQSGQGGRNVGSRHSLTGARRRRRR